LVSLVSLVALAGWVKNLTLKNSRSANCKTKTQAVCTLSFPHPR
jgi:hypothetical protein